MKKFMKAIAFATVMCLVLSTAAFAAVEVNNYETKNVTVTVSGVQKGEQVALVITKNGTDITQENVLFVDQKAAAASSAEFTATLTNAGETIDVYAGYASSGSRVLVADDFSLAAPVLEIEVTLVDVEIVKDITEVVEDGAVVSKADPDTKGALAILTINVANGTAGAITDMFWTFNLKNDTTSEAVTKYFRGDSTTVSALGSVLTGDVEIAAAINSTGYTLEDASAILKVNGENVDLAE